MKFTITVLFVGFATLVKVDSLAALGNETISTGRRHQVDVKQGITGAGASFKEPDRYGRHARQLLAEDKMYWDRLLLEASSVSLPPMPPPTAPPVAPPVAGPFCIDFDCGDGYVLRENPETRVGDDRETCCFREGVCAGAPVGSPCSLGDIGSSLIPNPSFENFTSCPTDFSQLDRAVDWVQATSATSDFWVGQPSCSDAFWKGGNLVNIPQNATDGDAFVGSIRQIRDQEGGGYFEYIGACLTGPLLSGVDYTFNLDIAAASDSSIYGGDTNGATDLLCIPDCNDFQIFGIDYKGDDYEILATVTPAGGLTGGGAWKSITFEVTPTQDCPAIMFGPALTQTVQAGQSASYVIYDFLNLQEGDAGECNAAGECVPVV